MNPLRLSVAFPLAAHPGDLEAAIPMFHRFLQKGQAEGLVLDVADYRHMPQGPGVMLIGHDVDYSVNDRAFQVVRKRSAGDTAATQLHDVLRMGLGFLDALAYDGALPGLDVDRSRFTVTVPDRALGARDDVAAALEAELAPVIAELYGADAVVAVKASDDPRRAAEIAVSADAAAASEVLAKLGGSQAKGQCPWDITPEDLVKLRESGAEFVLLDVREPHEYEIVTLDGQPMPLSTLGEHLDELDKDAHIVVHCRAGRRGAKAVLQMREAGFEDAWNLNGGLMAWADRIDPSLPRY